MISSIASAFAWGGEAACLLVVLALAPAPVAPAVITLANGEVVEGTVQGRVLTRRSSAQGDVAIRMLEGKDIAAIDRTGIRASGESVMLVAMKGATQDDLLQGLVFWDDGRRLKVGQALVREVRSGQVVGARIDNAKINRAAGEEFLGEYRINEGAKKVDLLSSIRLKKGDGSLVTIQVAEIVRFEQ